MKISLRKNRIVALVTVLAVLFYIVCVRPGKERDFFTGSVTNYTRTFNDMNEKHLEAAAGLGLKNVPDDREQCHSLRRKLVALKPCKLYDVDPLEFSVPYLTKGGTSLLEDIASNFRDSLASKGMPDARIVVTSVLRTKEDVQHLRESGNINASTNSAHCYGTTFDISWKTFRKKRGEVTPDELKAVLAEVLRDEMKQGRCYVKYEQKEACFHITSRLAK